MRIGIIGALEEEVQVLGAKINNVQEEQIAGQHFLIGLLEGHEVILLKCGVGKVNAAVGTTLLNQLFKPSYVINIGSAGGVNPTFGIGDFIISTEVRYHDVDLTEFGYEFGQTSQMPASFKPSEELFSVAEQCIDTLPTLKIRKGLITSGDSFLSSGEQISAIKSQFTEICAVEMEGCAVAHVCYLFNIPFIVIRVISDIVTVDDNKKTHEDNLMIVAEKLAEFIMCMLAKL